MAQPIRFRVPPVDSHDAQHHKVERAPLDHAAAILGAYNLLQAMHDRGILDTAATALKAGDEILDKLVETAKTPEAVRSLRNLLFWQKVLGSIEPQWFQGMFKAIPDALATATAERDEPVRVWKLVRRALSKDSLRGLAAAIDFLESFGRHLHALESSADNSPAR
jgi:uncharacterized protein YjgD (DUF1641 family)